MRIIFVIIFSILVLALGVCTIFAARSEKRIAKSVTRLLVALIPPVIGNSIIIISSTPILSAVGWYIYLVGMVVVILALLGFTFQYCGVTWPNRATQLLLHLLLLLDVAQILCNPFTGHVFRLDAVTHNGQLYYITEPLLGQSLHRLLVYCVFFAVLVIFFVKMIRAPKIYSERYSIILFTMVFVGMWETVYIFSRMPIDRSMIGFGVFGLLVFYFALYYRPMRLLDRMLSNVAQQTQETLLFFDAAGRCIWVNKNGAKMAGVEEDDYEGAALVLKEKFDGVFPEQDEWSMPYVMGSGSNARYYELQRHALRDSKGRADGFFLSIRDDTENQRTVKEELYTATHDKLTGLYTKDVLFKRTEEIVRANPEISYVAVFINVQDFKIVNDIFGHSFGDYALQRIADWIRENIPEDCICGRMGGDTFGICMPSGTVQPEAIERDLDNFVISDGTLEHQILIHVGIYPIPDPEMEGYLMFDRARMALTEIKDSYHKHINWYDDEMRERVLWSQYISSQLIDALEQRQIVPYLQPMLNVSGHVVGAEALVRWNHPEEGFLSPARFVPVFEKNGMIADVDRYMWRCACEILARWKREGKERFLSVNISPKDFYFMDVVEELRKLVREFEIDPGQLRVEITETIMMTDIENRIRMLNELKADGFMVEMDDFGSGYSSLNMLKDMPVDLLKIDMTFLNEPRNDQKAHTILHNIIRLSDELGISTLTEGVETQNQYQMLSSMGCSLFQGYYFAKPMPMDAFEEYCDAMENSGTLQDLARTGSNDSSWNAS